MRILLTACGLLCVLCLGAALWKWNSRASLSSDTSSSGPGSSAANAEKEKPVDSHPAQAVERGPLFFTEMRESSGIDFVHVTGDSPEKPFPAANGSGVAAFDYDRDGEIDLYFLSGTPFPLDPDRTAPVNRCYRHRGGWKFTDETAATGLGHNGYCAGVAIGDFDNDGFPDVFVNCYGPKRLYRNSGDGTFADVTTEAAIGDTGWGTSAAFLDYDNDGQLDLYVCNYAHWTPETNAWCGDKSKGVRIFCNPTTVEPAPAAFYHNEGDGRFRNVLSETGIGARLGRGQGVVATDLNDDGWIDLYVANDMHPNFLFVNNRQGGFDDQSEASGAAHDYQGRNQAGMGVDVGDLNRDGRLDLFVTNYEGEHNAYYECMAPLVYQDVSRSRGLAAESIPWVGWGTELVDFDLDGWLDVIVTNGHTDDNLQQMGRDSPYAQPAGVWRNRKGRFQYVGGAAAGTHFAGSHVGRGLATADFDHDGDLDVISVHQDAAPAILRNDSSEQAAAPPRWVGVELIGTTGARDAVGAEIRLETSDGVQIRPIKGGGSYCSASELRQFLALPAEGEACRIEVRWPSGRRQTLEQPAAGQLVRVVEPAVESF